MGFWSLIAEDGVHTNRYIMGFITAQPYFREALKLNGDVFQGRSHFTWLILYVQGGAKNPLQSRVQRSNCTAEGCPQCTQKRRYT